jgi:hypothetical protein
MARLLVRVSRGSPLSPWRVGGLLFPHLHHAKAPHVVRDAQQLLLRYPSGTVSPGQRENTIRISRSRG